MSDSGEPVGEPSATLEQAIVAFIVEGVPKSPSSKSRATWKSQVSGAAAKAWNFQEPIQAEIRVVIVHFYKRGSLDVDNMIKPILDAVTNVIFVDDSQVTQVLARKTELTTGLRVANAAPDVVAAIDKGVDCVYIGVLPAPDHRVMP